MSHYTINLEDIQGVAPLYMKYDGQCNPQDAYIHVNMETGCITADYSGDIGGNTTTSRRLSGLDRIYSIPATLSEAGIREAAESVKEHLELVAPEGEMIGAGYYEDHELEQGLHEIEERDQVWDFCDWVEVEVEDFLNPTRSESEVEKWVAEQYESAEVERVMVDTAVSDAVEWVMEQVEEAREEAEEAREEAEEEAA